MKPGGGGRKDVTKNIRQFLIQWSVLFFVLFCLPLEFVFSLPRETLKSDSKGEIFFLRDLGVQSEC